MADIRSLSRRALTQVREAVEGYRRPTLSGELAGARVALEAAGIELHVNEASEQLDPELEPVLAWAVREGATKVEAATAPAGGFRLLDVHSRMEAIRVAEERGWL